MIRINADGKIDFNSGDSINKLVVPFTYTGAMALNETGNLLALGTKQNMVHIYKVEYNDEAPFVVLNPIDSISSFLGDNTNGLSFDCADNLYGVSRTGELLGAWALAKGENTFTTPAPKSQKILIAPSTGLFDARLAESLVVYPNPVDDVLNLKFTNLKVERIELYDMSGQLLLFARPASNSSAYQLDMSSLSVGVYILKVKTTKGVVAKRILKT